MKWVMFPTREEEVTKRRKVMRDSPMINEVVLGAESLSTLTAPATSMPMTRQLEKIKGELGSLRLAISKIELTSEERKLDRRVNDVSTATVIKMYNEPRVGMKAKLAEKQTLSDLDRIESTAMLSMFLRQVRQLPGSETEMIEQVLTRMERNLFLYVSAKLEKKQNQ